MRGDASAKTCGSYGGKPSGRENGSGLEVSVGDRIIIASASGFVKHAVEPFPDVFRDVLLHGIVAPKLVQQI